MAREAEDTLQYFSGSADKAPGKGTGEGVSDPAAYGALAKITDWRRILSNFWEGSVPFAFDGRTYRTLEHAYQAEKFRRCGHPKVADTFTLESGTALARGDGLDARRARKTVVLTKAQLAPWIEHDTAQVRVNMYWAKFS